MSYLKWFEAHAKKHHDIVQKLLQKGYGDDEIVAYFDFDNMVEKEPEYCPLYAKNRKCHEMEHLNCYLCACPNFRFSDDALPGENGKTTYSFCAIDSKEGAVAEHNGAIHQDCSGCLVPHHSGYVLKHFDTDWKRIMQACPVEKVKKAD